MHLTVGAKGRHLDDKQANDLEITLAVWSKWNARKQKGSRSPAETKRWQLLRPCGPSGNR